MMRHGRGITTAGGIVALVLLLTSAPAAFARACRSDYCVPADWNAHAKPDSLTPGVEPLNVIIGGASNVGFDQIMSSLGDWEEVSCVSPETANVTGEGLVQQEQGWRVGGCRSGNIASLNGTENHVRIWSQPIADSKRASFLTASFETACVIVGKRHETIKGHLAFALKHPLSWWHCIDGGPGSFGSDGYDRGAASFVADVTRAADSHGWRVTSRLNRRPAGTGLNGVKYEGSVYVVTIRTKAPKRQLFIDGDDAHGDSFTDCVNCKLTWPAFEEPITIGLDAYGGTPPYTWTIEGGQPYDGLTISAVTDAQADFPFYGNDEYLLAGQLPAQIGNFTIPIRVQDRHGGAGTLELVFEQKTLF